MLVLSMKNDLGSTSIFANFDVELPTSFLNQRPARAQTGPSLASLKAYHGVDPSIFVNIRSFMSQIVYGAIGEFSQYHNKKGDHQTAPLSYGPLVVFTDENSQQADHFQQELLKTDKQFYDINS